MDDDRVYVKKCPRVMFDDHFYVNSKAPKLGTEWREMADGEYWEGAGYEVWDVTIDCPRAALPAGDVGHPHIFMVLEPVTRWNTTPFECENVLLFVSGV